MKSNGRPSVPNALDATVKPVIQAEEKGILTERGSHPKKMTLTELLSGMKKIQNIYKS